MLLPALIMLACVHSSPAREVKNETALELESFTARVPVTRRWLESRTQRLADDGIRLEDLQGDRVIVVGQRAIFDGQYSFDAFIAKLRQMIELEYCPGGDAKCEVDFDHRFGRMTSHVAVRQSTREHPHRTTMADAYYFIPQGHADRLCYAAYVGTGSGESFEALVKREAESFMATVALRDLDGGVAR